MINSIDRRTFEVRMRLDLPATFEFIGIKHRVDKPPVGCIRINGIEVFLTLQEVDDFTRAVLDLQTAAHQARERAEIAREPVAADSDPLGLKGQPR